jgi:hypothetical protein
MAPKAPADNPRRAGFADFAVHRSSTSPQPGHILFTDPCTGPDVFARAPAGGAASSRLCRAPSRLRRRLRLIFICCFWAGGQAMTFRAPVIT